MNWKKHYEPIKVGDIVKLIKYGCGNTNGDRRCCNQSGFYIGKTYKVYRISTDNTKFSIKRLDDDGICAFDINCVEKV